MQSSIRIPYFTFSDFVAIFGGEMIPYFGYRSDFDGINIHTLEWFQNPKQMDVRHLFLIAPPRSGKTAICTCLSAIYNALYNPKSVIRIVVGNNTLKGEINSAIHTLLKKSRKVKKIFGANVCRKGRKFYFPLGNDSIISVHTKGEPLLGAAAHFIYCDDFATYENVRSPTVRNNDITSMQTILGRTHKTMTTVASDYRGDVTKFFFINQFLGTDDISFQFLKQYKEAGVPVKELIYKYQYSEDTQYPLEGVFDDDGNQVCCVFSKGSFLLPTYSQEDLIKKKAEMQGNRARLAAEYHSAIIPSDYSIFDISKLKRYDYANIQEVLAKCTYYLTTVDFAFTENKVSDETASIVWGIAVNEGKLEFYMLDAIAGRFKFDVSLGILQQQLDKWTKILNHKRLRTVFEVEGNQAGVPQIMSTINGHPTTRGLKSKKERARFVSAVFNSGCMYFPLFLPNRTDDVVSRTIHQVTNLAYDGAELAHDDLVDNVVDILLLHEYATDVNGELIPPAITRNFFFKV